jgi:protein-L-isoaspartate(D-aspartate) O-methyltransferase
LQNSVQKAIIKAMHGRENKNKCGVTREQMLRLDLKGRDITNPDVLKVMVEVPREEFIPESYFSQAYADGPLPIGMGQTISQPYIVALMTQELRVNPDSEVLEIGTGSGYQTAVLSKLVKKVYTIERFPQLSESAQAVLGKLDVSNVEFYVGDGSCGWPAGQLPPSGCFDRIMITAAVPEIPEPLVKQLANGGFLVGPVGYGGVQRLVACEKRASKLIERAICDVRFVKLLGEYGFEQ